MPFIWSINCLMMRNIAIVGQGSKVYRTWGLNQIDLIPPNIYSFILFKNALSFFLKRSLYLYTFMTSFPFRKNNYRFYKKKNLMLNMFCVVLNWFRYSFQISFKKMSFVKCIVTCTFLCYNLKMVVCKINFMTKLLPMIKNISINAHGLKVFKPQGFKKSIRCFQTFTLFLIIFFFLIAVRISNLHNLFLILQKTTYLHILQKNII